ncbi:Fe-S protein assembly co-chaperone HscB [Bdellovibrionota bacterium FG-2]
MDRVSQPERTCGSCGLSDQSPDPSEILMCNSCGGAQPVPANRDYFALLGVPPRLILESCTLERRFYELSRALHPDRFSNAPPSVRRSSLEWMSLVNQAYKTLRDPMTRREYLLSLYGIDLAGQGGMPRELAENWFELQDWVEENPPEQSRTKVSDFRGRLLQIQAELNSRLSDLDRQIDEGVFQRQEVRAILLDLAQSLQKRTYLDSLFRDVQRLATTIEAA